MSQPNQDLPGWIVAISAAVPVAAVPFVWLSKKLGNKINRQEFATYLKKRDDLSDERHISNTRLLEDIRGDLSNARERLCAIEGEMKGRYD